MDAARLAHDLRDARARTLALVADLSDEQMAHVPLLPIVNPPLWEIGHVAWFQERWALRHLLGLAPVCAESDALYDSAEVHHDSRWRLPLPPRAETLGYMEAVLARVLERLERAEGGVQGAYFHRLVAFHEDMHGEALVYTRQTLGWPAPSPCADDADDAIGAGPLPGDVEVPGGTFLLGATDAEEFVFDNEKWAHAVELEPFRIARAPVTQGEFAEFVDAGGYRHAEWWSTEGWRWRSAERAEHPLYWQRSARGWSRRSYDRWVAIEEHRPVLHVNAYEAEAYCGFAGRRLPSEAEWEAAASGVVEHGHLARAKRRFPLLACAKRRFPWGDEPPTAALAHLDLCSSGCADVAAYPAGDSAFGCRQMIGNVWEWTASKFGPYPGFVVDPYREYSQPWFGTHKVLRGGSFATRRRLLRNTWRNFYTPDRRDVLAGFRTVRGMQPR